MQERRGVLDSRDELRGLSVADLPSRPTHATAALVDPAFFDLVYDINPHMDGEVDSERARRQWEELRTVYERQAPDVRVLDPAAVWDRVGTEVEVSPPSERPDMVFVANHALPAPEGDRLVLARMATPERAGEPAYFEAWARQQGYAVEPAPTARFEGAGDAIWHPGRRLLWGGHGVRTDRQAYDELADRLDSAVVPLELVDERYFHLDLCLLPLSETEALVQPDAFTGRALDSLDAVFESIIEAPADESLDSFAVNGEVIDDTVVAGSGAPETASRLETAGYDVVSVETGEFRKAGGSVGCLTLWLGPVPDTAG
jgi:N-dimethylarginine dimethylaminohydrolase